MTSNGNSSRGQAGDDALLLMLARLARKGARLAPLDQDHAQGYALLGPPGRPRRKVRRGTSPDLYGADLVSEALRRGHLVYLADGVPELRLSEAGAIAIARGAPRRMPSPQAPAARQAAPVRRTIAESTIARLRRTRGPDGTALISSAEAEAAERLAADFEKGRMGPRVTASYDPAAISDKRRHASGPFGPDVAEARAMAQHRVRKALQAAGGELANVLLDVCCLDRRLEDVERARGWPQRSGRLVLRIALRALARHYGIASVREEGAQRTRAWASADFAPTLDAWFGAERAAKAVSRPEA